LHYVKESPNPQHSSAALAFTGLGLLNLPGFALIYALKFAAARDLAKKLNQLVGTFAGRSITEISTVLRTREVALGIASQEEFSRAAHWWITRIGFSAQGLREGYFWTIITSCFFHLEFLHLLRSLIGIYEFSGPCAQIPGMNAWHVGVVTVGSCIVTNLFGLVQYSGVLSTARGAPPLPMQACGGSGIVAAFMGIAVMYKPLERVGWGVAGTTITVPLWVYSGLFVFGNALSLSMTLGIVNLPLLGAHPHVAYAAHLSGAAFGAGYYWLILRPQNDPEMLVRSE
jgi:membrane associated rhomboid family serine protease